MQISSSSSFSLEEEATVMLFPGGGDGRLYASTMGVERRLEGKRKRRRRFRLGHHRAAPRRNSRATKLI